MQLGRMVRSSSNYASPFFPVKKSDGKWRFVADYTRLNEVTLKDDYVPPRIDDLLARIPFGCIFSKIDFQKAFFQIPIEKADQSKLPWSPPIWSVWIYSNANGSQECISNPSALRRFSSCRFLQHYRILWWYSPFHWSRELQRRHRRSFLAKLHKAGLVVKKGKFEFKVNEIIFLGHKITQSGYQPSEAKIMGLQQFQTSKTVKQVRRFLCMINFLRKFIPHASEIQQPLTALTRRS